MRIVWTLRCLLTLTFLLLVSSCSKDTGQLVVLVGSDFAQGELTTVFVRAVNEASGEASTQIFNVGDGAEEVDVPFSFGVAPIGGAIDQVVSIELEAFGPWSDEPLRTRRKLSSFASNEILMLPIYLAKECRDVTCEEGQTCTERGCQSEEVSPTDLEKLASTADNGLGRAEQSAFGCALGERRCTENTTALEVCNFGQGWVEATCAAEEVCNAQTLGCVSATEPLKTFEVAVDVQGLSTGATGIVDDINAARGATSVVRNCAGVSAAVGCTGTYAEGAQVTLKAASALHDFVRWVNGPCDGSTESACTFRVSADASMIAQFDLSGQANNSTPVTMLLSVAGEDESSGEIALNPASRNGKSACSSAESPCTLTYIPGQSVTLGPLPGANSEHTSWGGICLGAKIGMPCTVSVQENSGASAQFGPQAVGADRVLTVSMAQIDGGEGEVVVAPMDRDGKSRCTTEQGSCVFTFGPDVSAVTVTAKETSPSTFAGWEGACAGNPSECTLSLTGGNASTTVRFQSPGQGATRFLSINVFEIGSATGEVNVEPNDLAGNSRCTAEQSPCVFEYNVNAPVTLTEKTSVGMFERWGGSCSQSAGQSTCMLTMANNLTAEANFNSGEVGDIESLLVEVNSSGGSGTVTANPADTTGASVCASPSCSLAYSRGQVVSLQAVADDGSVFDRWEGDCTGTDPSTCSVSMGTPRIVRAFFVSGTGGSRFNVTVINETPGLGVIDSEPFGIAGCAGTSGTCSFDFQEFERVSLIATPGSGNKFTMWTDDNVNPVCAGQGPCRLSADPIFRPSGYTIRVRFGAQTTGLAQLAVVVGGSGVGRVFSNSTNSPIDCGVEEYFRGTCFADYNIFSTLDVVAVPGPGSRFVEWRNECFSKERRCSFSGGSDSRQVEAVFEPIWSPDLDGDGTPELVVGTAAGVSKPSETLVLEGPFLSPLNANVAARTSRAYSQIGYAQHITESDINDDFIPDLLVGVPEFDNNRGRVFVLFGEPGFELPASGIFDVAADAIFEGAAQGDRFGSSIGVVRDIDGDLQNEVVVGAPGANRDLGRAYLFRGEVFTGVIGASSAETTFEGEGGNFGSRIVAEDLNGDAFEDVIVAAPEFDFGSSPNAGRVYVFPGSSLTASVPTTLSGMSDALLLTGDTPGLNLGDSMSALGDFDGDGLGDLALGAPGASQVLLKFGEVGLVPPGDLLYSIAAAGNNAVAINGPPGASFPASIAGGHDFTGNGYTDLVASSPSYAGPAGMNSGAVLIWQGGVRGAAPSPTPNLTLWGNCSAQSQCSSEQFGTHLAPSGDLNGDRWPELVVGAAFDLGTEVGHGRTYTFFGGPLEMVSGESGGDADMILTGDGPLREASNAANSR